MEGQDEIHFTSVVLSRYLDYLELSEDHIATRVSRFRYLQVLAGVVDYRPDFQPTIITGSAIDGIWWKGYQSDLDTMILVPYVTVVDSKYPTTDLKGYLFEIVEKGVHSGYVRLRLKQEGSNTTENMFTATPGGIKAHCIEENGEYYLPSYNMKKFFLRYQQAYEHPPWVYQTSYHYATEWPSEDDVIDHGPSVCFKDDTKNEPPSDRVPCFPCPIWPSEANEWITRKRNWPPKEKVDGIVAEGIKVVAVGFIGSETRHLEWRLSFALTERDLIRCFNNTQHKCYALLKMILKEVLLKDDTEGVKQLNSFHMKNTMLWSIEGSDPDVWCADRMAEALQICINNLHSWLKTGFAPSFFIRTNNVFQGKVEGSDREMFEKMLAPFANTTNGWNVLLQCPSLSQPPECGFQQVLDKCREANEARLDIPEVPMPEKADIWYKHDLSLFPRFEHARVEVLTNINAGKDVSLAVHQHYSLLEKIQQRRPTSKDGDVLEPILRAIESSLGSHLYGMSLLEDAVTQSDHARLAKTYLEKGKKSDACSGNLKLANYHYMNGNYSECLDLVHEVLENDHVLPTYMPQLLSSLEGPSKLQTEKFRQFITGSTKEAIEKRYLSAACHAVIFLPSEMNAAPDAVKHQLRKALPDPFDYTYWLGWAVYDAPVYAYFLRFLCHIEQNHTAQAKEALTEIEDLHRRGEVAYASACLNLIGFAYLTLKELGTAISFFIQAAENDIIPNTAVYQLSASLYSSMKESPLQGQ